jgi:hypothetical protein
VHRFRVKALFFTAWRQQIWTRGNNWGRLNVGRRIWNNADIGRNVITTWRFVIPDFRRVKAKKQK